MNQSDFIGSLQPLRDVDADPHGQSGVKPIRVAVNHAIKPLAGDQFHDDVGLPMNLPEGIDLRHIRVVQFGGGLGLALEAFHKLGIFAERLEHDLDRHQPAQRFVARPVDGTHATATDEVEQAECAEAGGNGVLVAALGAGNRGKRLKRGNIHQRLALGALGFRDAVYKDFDVSVFSHRYFRRDGRAFVCSWEASYRLEEQACWFSSLSAILSRIVHPKRSDSGQRFAPRRATE